MEHRKLYRWHVSPNQQALRLTHRSCSSLPLIVDPVFIWNVIFLPARPLVPLRSSLPNCLCRMAHDIHQTPFLHRAGENDTSSRIFDSDECICKKEKKDWGGDPRRRRRGVPQRARLPTAQPTNTHPHPLIPWASFSLATLSTPDAPFRLPHGRSANSHGDYIAKTSPPNNPSNKQCG